MRGSPTAMAALLIAFSGLALGCRDAGGDGGIEVRDQRAHELLIEAMEATRAHRFEDAEASLGQALEGLPVDLPIHDELVYQRDYRIPFEKFWLHLRKHRHPEVAAAVSALEAYVESHPERVEEVGQVAELRRVEGYLELSLATLRERERALLEPLLTEVLIDAPELPNNGEELARLLEQASTWNAELASLLDKLDLESYELRGRQWLAIFTDKASGETISVPLGVEPAASEPSQR